MSERAISVEKFDLFKDIDRSLETNWVRFLSDGSFPETLRPVIAHSWERCLINQIDPLKLWADIVCMDKNLKMRRETNQYLLEAALPWMDEMYQFYSNQTISVVICDSQGVILDGRASRSTWAKLEGTNFIPGADWSEKKAGTNAIGTALTEQKPVQVFSAEHFCQGWHPWVCSAAPIQDPVTGTLLGVLDVTGEKGLVHAHDLHLVILQAKKIEQSIHERLLQQNFELVQFLFNMIQEPVLIFNAQGTITKCNIPASHLLQAQTGKSIEPLIHVPKLQDMLNDLREKPVHGYYRAADGCEWKIEVRPYRCEERLLGGLAYYRRVLASLPAKKTAKGTRYTFAHIVTRDASLERILEFSKRIAVSEATVLITGETGTGKEMLAQSIHAFSPRGEGPFVGVNCGAIPKELMASELFGYEGGAFTGAKSGGKKGLVTAAEGGTLFLDEIGDLSLEAQVYLLRMLEEREVCPVGSTRPVPVNVRIIAATHRDLRREVRRGRFREDLFYRLQVVHIDLPPLRERKQDIPLLIQHFLRTSPHGGVGIEIDPEAMERMVNYSWPGNIRQLRNCVERALLSSSDGKIKVENLPDEIRALRPSLLKPEPQGQEIQALSHGHSIYRLTRGKVDKDTLIRALEEAGGNVSQASRSLRVSRMTIYRKLREFGITLEYFNS